MSRPAAEDALMDDEGSAASSRSSDAGDDLLHDDSDQPANVDSMLLERDEPATTPSRPRPALAPTSSSASHLPSPPGPSARRSSARTFVRSTPGGGGGGTGRNARLERASAAFGEGGGAFERERERLGGRGGGGGPADEARSAEESAWSKVLDKEYTGKITYDPFLHQLNMDARHASSTAAAAGTSSNGTAAAPSAPAAAASTPSAATAAAPTA
ncbi:hypothetical protein JCM8208_003288 [Rhodotorula glutinis]